MLFRFSLLMLGIAGMACLSRAAPADEASQVFAIFPNPQRPAGSYLIIRPFDGNTFGPVIREVQISGGDPYRSWWWNGSQAATVTYSLAEGSMFQLQPFDGMEFGQAGSRTKVSGGDPYRGWSWDGKLASDVTVSDGKDILLIRPFDGHAFGAVTKQFTLSGGDPIRGWCWRDGTTASYIAYSNGKNYLAIQPFDGSSFKPERDLPMGDGDIYRGWDWDGKVASYVAVNRYAASTEQGKSGVSFPIKGEAHSVGADLGHHRNFDTTVSLGKDGHVEGMTHIWNGRHFEGFTCAGVVGFLDASGNTIFISGPHSYGVDGTLIPGKPSERTERWVEDLTTEQAGKVTHIEIIHYLNPTPRLDAAVDEIRHDAIKVIKAWKDVVKEIYK